MRIVLPDIPLFLLASCIATVHVVWWGLWYAPPTLEWCANRILLGNEWLHFEFF